jgi:hypothetical protein
MEGGTERYIEKGSAKEIESEIKSFMVGIKVV